jgi:alkylated DNA repair protein (DNA oxidative demethylase)
MSSQVYTPAAGLPLNLPSGGTGLRLHPEYFSRDAQAALLGVIRRILSAAPLYIARMPKSGRPMSVGMSNCGSLGWFSDETGYRYERAHPQTGRPWPAIPDVLLRLWEDVARYPHAPEACLINYYGPQAKMGLHQDRDETDFAAPVVSVSLGDACLFRIGGNKRGEPTRSFRLNSGDVLVMGGDARLAFHGVDRVYAGTSGLLAEGGRINLTLRRATLPRG